MKYFLLFYYFITRITSIFTKNIFYQNKHTLYISFSSPPVSFLSNKPSMWNWAELEHGDWCIDLIAGTNRIYATQNLTLWRRRLIILLRRAHYTNAFEADFGAFDFSILLYPSLLQLEMDSTLFKVLASKIHLDVLYYYMKEFGWPIYFSPLLSCLICILILS